MAVLSLASIVLLFTSNGYLQLVGALLIFLVVLVITAFVTRYVGGVQKSLGQGKNIKVIDTSRIAPNKYLQIVKVGDKYYCIGITQDQITLISEIDEKSLLFKDESQNISFADLLNKFTEKKLENSEKSYENSDEDSVENSIGVSLEVRNKDE